MKKLIFIFIASICLIENSNALTTDIIKPTTCIKATRPQCYYEHKTPDETTCSDDACASCKDEPSDIVNNGVKQTSTRIFHENCPDQNGKYTCRCETTITYECAKDFYGTATLASTGCTKCPDNAECKGGNNSTFTCKDGYTKNTDQTSCVKEGLTCSDTQFIYDGKCYDCPNTGGCDGVNLTCNDDFIQEGPNCICKKDNQNGYIDSTHCIKCPEHATCDGLKFTCNKTFTPTPNACTCRPDQFINNNQCTSCPANASCNGGDKFSCRQSFYKTNNTCTQCPHNGTTDGDAEKLSECYLPTGQYENDAGYFEIIKDDKKCYATNK